MMKSRAKTLATAAALAGVPVPAKVPTTTVKSIPAVRQQTANATYNQSLRADPEKHTHRLLTLRNVGHSRRHSLKSAKPSAATESELRDAMAAAAKEVYRAEGLLERDSSNRARAAITPRHMTTRANEIRRQAKDSIESHESLTAPVDAASTDWDRELRRALMEKDAAGGDSCAWCANPSQRARWNALLLFSKSMLAIPLGLPCKVCNESWPATEMGRRATVFDATTDTCKRCDLDMGEVKKYSKENDMDPGDIPDHLPELTVVEEALIATAHQHIQVMRNTGGSAKYRGHTCVFEQEIGAFLTTLPPRLNELNILLVRKSSDDGSFSKVFRVRRDAVFQWLTFLKANHPAYREVTIDLANLNLLPGDDYVGDRLPQVLDDDELEPAAAVPAAGMAPAQPPGGGLPPDESGVISLKAGAMENAALLNTLRRAQLGIRQDDPSLPRDAVAWPTHGPDPMNEFTQYDLMARVFPTLFPTGVCMFVPADGRRHDVKFASYVLHLLRHKSRRFAQHPRWRYTVLNQQLRWQALTSSRVFVAREQQHLTLDQLADAVARGDNSVSGGLQRFASKLRGTDGFWRSNKAKGYAFMAFLEYFFDRMPTTFTTISGAEVHWRWFHRLLHGSDAYLDPLAEPMDPSAEFKLRAELVALNPALSAWGFHHMTNEWFKHVLYKHGNFVDHMSRTEFAKRGMPHKHVLAVLKDAPTITELEAAFAQQAVYAENQDSEVGPLMLGIIDRFRQLVEITAFHPEPTRALWSQKPEEGDWPTEGERSAAEVRSFKALTTPLHLVPDNAVAMRDHCAELATRCMLHLCCSYCLRKDPTSKEKFCRSGYGRTSVLRATCDCKVHETAWRLRTAADALANADPPVCPSCRPPPPPPNHHPQPCRPPTPAARAAPAAGATTNKRGATLPPSGSPAKPRAAQKPRRPAAAAVALDEASNRQADPQANWLRGRQLDEHWTCNDSPAQGSGPPGDETPPPPTAPSVPELPEPCERVWGTGSHASHRHRPPANDESPSDTASRYCSVLRSCGWTVQQDLRKSWVLCPPRNHGRLVPLCSWFLMGIGANVDIQCILDQKALVNYIMKYAMKTETKSLPFLDAFKKILEHATRDVGDVKSVCAKAVNHSVADRDYSAQEVTHHLLGLPLVETSRAHTVVQFGGSVELVLDKENQPTTTKSFTDWYSERPAVLQAMNAYELAARFALRTKNPYTPRTRIAVPNIKPYSPFNAAKQVSPANTRFYKQTLMLYRPWPRGCTDFSTPAALMVGHESEDPESDDMDSESLPDDAMDSEDAAVDDVCIDQLWYDAFHKWLPGAPICVQRRYTRVLQKYLDQANEAVAEVKRKVSNGGVMDEDDGSDAAGSDDMDDDMRVFQRNPCGKQEAVEEDVDPVATALRDVSVDELGGVYHGRGEELKQWLDLQKLENPDPPWDPQSVSGVSLAALEGRQLLAVRIVHHRVLRHFNASVPPPPLYLTIKGAGGCGKSHVIKAITKLAHKLSPGCLDPGPSQRVALCAYTGTAAFNIGGTTLHHLLSLPTKKYSAIPKGSKKLRDFQARLANLTLIILDEHSMVGLATLGNISQRLKEAKEIDLDFGGVSIVFVGDEAQLQPVLDSPKFGAITKTEDTAKVKGKELYQNFKEVVELQRAYRQNAAEPFYDLLTRLRDNKHGEADYLLIKSRILTTLPPAEQALFRNAVRPSPHPARGLPCCNFPPPVLTSRALLADALLRHA